MHLLDQFKQLAGNYLNLLDALPYPIAVVRAVDGRLLGANRRFLDYLKPPGEEMAGLAGTGFIDCASGLHKEETFCDRLRMQIIDDAIIQFESSSGFRSQMKADVRPVQYNGQDSWLVVAVVEPEKKPAEEKDFKGEENYRELVENLNDIVYTTDQNAVVTYVSPNILQVSGYEPSEVIGKSFTEFVHPEDLQGRIEQFLKILSGAKEATEYRYITKTGEIKWARTNSRPILRDQRVAGVQGVLVDISDRKEIEEALRSSEEKYRILVQNSKDAIFVIQGDRIKFMNPSALEILGFPCEAISDRPFWEFIHPDDRAVIMERYSLRLRGKSLSDRVAFRILTKGGDVRDVDLNAVSITWEGEPAVLNFLRDVTVQKRMEDQLRNAQKLEALGTLSGGISHNFNNLLMGIHGNATLALNHLAPSVPGYKHLEKIINLVQSGSKLTRQLLEYARGGACEMSTVDLNQLVRDVSETLTATKKHIQIHYKLSGAIPCIKADQGQIEQVLLNLLLNSADAMADGGEVIIETSSLKGRQAKGKVNLAKNMDYVLVKVSDCGTGIPREIMDRIFEPFFTTKGLGRGTGLGLSTAFGIVKNHNGDICVESEANKGSSFFIYLPALSPDPTSPEANLESKEVAGQETILLVDDDPVVIEAVALLLERLGFTVLQASSASAAIEIFQKHWKRIDLAILDLVLPNMSGKEVYYKFREINPHVKVLLSSGFSLSGQAEELLGNGCKGFIQKPYDITMLSAMMTDILSAE
jgi:two-component system cell cycle sensor histidine kinase/response regulator CckA